MLGLSFAEFSVILIVALVMLGPEDIPKVARQIIRFMKSLRAVGDELRAAMREITEDEAFSEVKRELQQERRFLMDESGRLQEIYDMSDFLSEEEMRSYEHEMIPITHSEQDSGKK